MLVFVFLLALFVRSYFAYDISADNGYIVSGGSDSYYWRRIIDYNAETGENLFFDPLLNYPHGGVNPRPPFYSMSVAVPAVFAQGMFDSLSDSIGFMLIWSTAFWGALTVIPVYFLGKETFGRRAGLAAAFFFAVMPAHVQRSVLSNADHDSIVLFFIVLIFYFLLKAVKTQDHKRWVSSWRSIPSIKTGLRDYIAGSRTPIMYALMAGVAYSVLMMTWVGFAYVTVLILAYYIIQLLINRFRNQDSSSVTILLIVSLGFGYLIALPYYANYYDIFMEVRFLVPVYLSAGAIVFGLMFVLTRDYPWTLSLPAIVGVLIVAVLGVSMIYPALGEAIMTGQGYFSQSKLYTTIAEARAPLFSELALSFGMVTFFMSLAGLIWAMMRIPKRATSEFIFIVVWLGAAIFMAISAGRFMFNAAPAFALAAGWVLVTIVDALDFNSVRKSLAGASGSFLQIFRKSIKIRHIMGVLFLGFLVILPNVWYSVDAGIPSETKRAYDKQIYSSLPSFMQQEGYDSINGSNWYLGAFGYSLPLPTYYYPSAWAWFGEQDADVYPVSSRPAYVAWWDYGFEAIQEGKHPTIADNFQNGYQMAGNIIMAQGEQDAIALFSMRIVQWAIGQGGSIESSVANLLDEYDVDVERMYDILRDPGQQLIDEVLSDPDRYGPMSNDLSEINARIVAGRVELASIGLEKLVNLYNEICDATGIEIRYFNVDSRLFPLSGTETGIFYAPAKLSDRRLDEERGSIPIDFYSVKAVDDRGVEYDLDELTPDVRITNYILEYHEMFYDSMFYRAMCGFSGSEIGLTDEGLPGASGVLQKSQPMPGWNMTHFRMVYRTAYYNPYPADEVAYHSKDWMAISFDEALELQKEINRGDETGVVDYSASSLYRTGTVFLKYYHGAYINGTVTTEEGEPVEGIRATVLDEYDIPHHTVLTDSEGRYSVLAPFGNVTLTLSDGLAENPSLVGANKIESFEFNITDDQAMRIPQDLDNDGILDYIITQDYSMRSTRIWGDIYWDVDAEGNYTADVDEFVADATVYITNLRSERVTVVDVVEGSYEVYLPPGTYRFEVFCMGSNRTISDEAVVEPGSTAERSLGVQPVRVGGYLLDDVGSPVGGVELVMTELESGFEQVAVTTSDGAYEFSRLVHGRYDLTTNEPSKVVFDEKFGLMITSNLTRNVTLYDSCEVSVKVVHDGLVAPGAVYQITDNYDAGRSVTGVADKYGWVREEVPLGEWTLYSTYSSGTDMYAGSIRVDATAHQFSQWLDLDLGYDVIGGASSHTGSAVSGEYISFASDDGTRVYARTTSIGGFHTVLPAGVYEVTFRSSVRSTIHSSELVVQSDIIGIKLEGIEAIKVSGAYVLDANSDGTPMASEYPADGRMVVTDQDGRTFMYTSESNGSVELIFPRGLRVTVSSGEPEYSTWSKSHLYGQDVTDILFIASPDEVSLQGTVLFEGEGVGGLLLTFEPEIDSLDVVHAVSDLLGRYAVSVKPSLYNLMIDEPVASDDEIRYQNQTSMLVDPSATPTALDIDLFKRVLVSGNVLGAAYNVSLSLTGPESMEVDLDLFSYSTYLIPGEYTAYATGWLSGSEYANLTTFVVSEASRSHSVNLVPARTLGGIIYLEDSRATKPVDIVARSLLGSEITNKSLRTGQYSLTLPLGTYIVSYVIEELYITTDRSYYVEYADELVVVIGSEDVELDPSLPMRFDNTTLSGSVVDEDGNPIVASLRLVPNGKYGEGLEFVTGSSGKFSVSVQPGTYTVYCSRSVDDRVALTSISILRNTPATLDLELEHGEYLQGVVTIDGVGTSEQVSVTSGGAVLKVMSGSDGRFRVIVPSGNYTAFCSTTRIESGLEVRYSRSRDASVEEGSVFLSMSLTRDTRRSVSGYWNESMAMKASRHQTISYAITVENTGNIDDTYTLECGETAFDVSFEPSEVAVDFGTTGNIEFVVVQITVGEMALSGDNNLTVTLKSDSQSSIRADVKLLVKVSVVRNVTVENLNVSDTVSSTSSSTKFLVNNTGNVADTYVLDISNLDTLSSMGWSARIVDVSTGEEVTEVSLQAFETREFMVEFTATRPQPNPAASAVVMAYSSDYPNVVGYGAVTVILPDLSVGPGDMAVSRGDVTYEYDIGRVYMDIGLGVTLAAMVAMFFILRKRRGLSGGGKK